MWWGVFDKKGLGEVVLLRGQALLVELELPQARGLLMLHRADVLYQVQLDLGGVIAHGTVVIAGFGIHRALLLLQVLKERDVSLEQCCGPVVGNGQESPPPNGAMRPLHGFPNRSSRDAASLHLKSESIS